MVKHLTLPRLVRGLIEKHGGKRADLARALGWTNVNKGCNCIRDWLAGDAQPDDERIPRLAEALDLSPAQLHGILTADRLRITAERQEKRAADPTWSIRARICGGLAGRTLSGDVDAEEAVAEARADALRLGVETCVNGPDGVTRWLRKDGTVWTTTGMLKVT